MDKEEARFILRCFRPDGSDAADPSFAEALQLAAEDRELGEWLARERASDAAFTESLGRLELPTTLRDEILTGLAAERGDVPVADEWDASLIGAMAQVQPPLELRREILLAMNRSAGVGDTTFRRPSWGGWLARFGLPLAAAAGIVLALMIGNDSAKPDRTATVDLREGAIQPASTLEDRLIRILTDPDFDLDRRGPDFGKVPERGVELDLKDPDHKELFRMVRDELGRACPQGCLPKGLRVVPGIGCKEVDIDGMKGAIVCFSRGKNDTVHLVVFRRSELRDEYPIPTERILKQHGDWAVAEWQEKGRAFVMLGNTDKEHLGEVF